MAKSKRRARAPVLSAVLIGQYSKIAFYCFPTDVERRCFWIADINCKNWVPSEHSWICSAQFISGCKSSDPMSHLQITVHQCLAT